ncbi:MAG: hypothetical protein WC607_02685 [Candidatus Micrarchaeia archaeon]
MPRYVTGLSGREEFQKPRVGGQGVIEEELPKLVIDVRDIVAKFEDPETSLLERKHGLKELVRLAGTHRLPGLPVTTALCMRKLIAEQQVANPLYGDPVALLPRLKGTELNLALKAITDEAERAGFPGTAVTQILQSPGADLKLLAGVTHEYRGGAVRVLDQIFVHLENAIGEPITRGNALQAVAALARQGKKYANGHYLNVLGTALKGATPKEIAANHQAVRLLLEKIRGTEKSERRRTNWFNGYLRLKKEAGGNYDRFKDLTDLLKSTEPSERREAIYELRNHPNWRAVLEEHLEREENNYLRMTIKALLQERKKAK